MLNDILTADIIAITGHRNFTDVGALYRGLDRTNARQYIFGGARGIDSRALEYVGKTRPYSMRTVVVPNQLSHQPYQARVVISKYATNIVELRNTGYNRYQLRNEYMVNKSSAVRAFYDYRPTGGTYNTIQYARSIGKPVGIWGMETVDFDVYNKMSPDRFLHWMDEMKQMEVSEKSLKGIVLNFINKLKGQHGRVYIPSILDALHKL